MFALMIFFLTEMISGRWSLCFWTAVL
jgi:hypothetical protein